MVAARKPTRPKLRRIEPPQDWRGKALLTMSIGQWDQLLAGAYEAGWYLLELDDNEQPVAVYHQSKGLAA